MSGANGMCSVRCGFRVSRTRTPGIRFANASDNLAIGIGASPRCLLLLRRQLGEPGIANGGGLRHDLADLLRIAGIRRNQGLHFGDQAFVFGPNATGPLVGGLEQLALQIALDPGDAPGPLPDRANIRLDGIGRRAGIRRRWRPPISPVPLHPGELGLPLLECALLAFQLPLDIAAADIVEHAVARHSPASSIAVLWCSATGSSQAAQW